MKFGINDQLDIVELLNEPDYKSVADVMKLQMESNSAGLRERKICADHVEG